MEQQKDILQYKKCVYRDVKEHLLETQLHLPDYYPDICRILYCQVKPYKEHCNVEGDRVVLDAIAEIRLLYCDADNRMQLYSTEQRYAKNAVLSQPVQDAIVQCSQNVVSCTYRAVGPRRVDVKACISVSSVVWEQTQLQIVPEHQEGVEVLIEEKEFFDLHVLYGGSFVINESFSVQDDRLKESRILLESCHVSTTEIKIVSDKILIKGYLDMQLSCLCEKENNVFKFNESVAYSQVIDLYGLTETDICNVSLEAQKLNLSFRDNGECDVTLPVYAMITAGERKNMTVVKDLFAVRGHARAEFNESVTGICCRPFNENFLCTAHAEKSDVQSFEMLASNCNTADYTVVLEDGELIVRGSAEICALLQTDAECRYIARKVQFEQSRAFSEAKNGSVFATLVCKGVSCGKTTDGLQLKAEMELNGCVFGEETIRFAQSYSLEESEEPSDDCRISVYFAQAGERMWSIAKENGVSLQRLRDMNDLHDEELKENRILLLMKA